jgi:hypothetical protein
MSARLLDPKDNTGRYPFVYTKAADTDLSRTFARIRAEQEARKRESGGIRSNVRLYPFSEDNK